MAVFSAGVVGWVNEGKRYDVGQARGEGRIACCSADCEANRQAPSERGKKPLQEILEEERAAPQWTPPIEIDGS